MSHILLIHRISSHLQTCSMNEYNTNQFSSRLEAFISLWYIDMSYWINISSNYGVYDVWNVKAIILLDTSSTWSCYHEFTLDFCIWWNIWAANALHCHIMISCMYKQDHGGRTKTDIKSIFKRLETTANGMGPAEAISGYHQQSKGTFF